MDVYVPCFDLIDQEKKREAMTLVCPCSVVLNRTAITTIVANTECAAMESSLKALNIENHQKKNVKSETGAINDFQINCIRGECKELFDC